MTKTQQMRVGIIAPPWLPVPPQMYGGTELAIDVLARGLQQLGHDIRLFSIGASTCDVPNQWVFETAMPEKMGTTMRELHHVAAAYDALAGCDIVHDHTLAGLFVSQLHPQQTVVTTNHGAFNDDLADLYGRTAARVPLIAISHDQAARAPADVPIRAVIHHGLDLDRYPIGRGRGDYLVALSRMNPDKGLDTAIEVARRAGIDLFIAAKMQEPAEKQYFEAIIRPKLGPGVEYLGEVDQVEKVALLQDARALLNPIRWPEPFGLVMAEAQACGTPVVGTPCGAAPEIIDHRTTGFLARTTADLVRGVEEVGDLDRMACRSLVERRFSMSRMARDHESLYYSIIAGNQQRRSAVAAPNRPTNDPGNRTGSTPRRYDRSYIMSGSRPLRSIPLGSASIDTSA